MSVAALSLRNLLRQRGRGLRAVGLGEHQLEDLRPGRDADQSAQAELDQRRPPQVWRPDASRVEQREWVTLSWPRSLGMGTHRRRKSSERGARPSAGLVGKVAQ